MEAGALDANKLHPLWSLLLHDAKIGQKEVREVANVRWITRVVQQFLNQNSAKDIYEVLTDALWPGLVDMLSNSMKKQRKGGPEPADTVEAPSDEVVERYKRERNKPKIEQNEFRENLKRQREEADAKLEEVKKNKLVQQEQEAVLAAQREVSKLATTSDASNHIMEEDDHSIQEKLEIKKYQIFSEQEITEESRQTIEEIGSLLETVATGLNQDSTNARLLLHHAQWNKPEIIKHLTAQTSKSSRDKFLRDAGIKLDLSSNSNPKSETKECLICMDDFEFTPNPKLHLACDHFPTYCNSCWKENLEVQITELAQSCVTSTQCMSPGCNSVITESIFKHFVSSEKFKRYQSYQVRSFIDDNPHVKFCPCPGCNFSVRLEDDYFDANFPKDDENKQKLAAAQPAQPQPQPEVVTHSPTPITALQPRIPTPTPAPGGFRSVIGRFRRAANTAATATAGAATTTAAVIASVPAKITRAEVQATLEQNKGQPVIPIHCNCGDSFCFRCHDYSLGDHSPARCDWIEIWNAKQSSENQNLEWLLQNTKKCPKCKRHIEKNGGCMHMTCQKHAGGCGHEFCWLCRGDWRTHGSQTGGYYACNKYEQDKTKFDTIDKEGGTSEEDAKEYMFFFHRYDSHKKAMEVAREQVKKAKEKKETVKEIAHLREEDEGNLKGLEKAAIVLLENRRALMWSYVFGWFLSLGKTEIKFSDEEKKREMALFQYLQEDLEKYTNYLSEIYEKDLQEVLGKGREGYVEWMREMNKVSGVCQKFLVNFNEGLAKGLTKV